MSVFVCIGERLSKRLRERYLAATLRQNIAFFDDVGPGEIATRIQTDTHLVQEGTAEKVALTVYYISTFVTGCVHRADYSCRLRSASLIDPHFMS